MGCDGIWECLTNQQLIDFIAKKKAAKQSESQIIESLLDNIIAPDTATGIGCDNMTTILITVNKN